MARHEVNRAAACYHAFVAILLLLMGGGMLGFGIWLEVSNRGGPVDLQLEGVNFFNVVLGAAIIAMVIGAFFIITSIVSLIALARKCVGKVFRVIYILLALLILAALVLVATVGFLIVANRDLESVKKYLKEAWDRTAAKNKLSICGIERALDCRGFTDPNCGPSETCVDCGLPSTLQSGKQSCYEAIKDDLRHVFLPLAIISAILAIVVLIDIFVVCAL